MHGCLCWFGYITGLTRQGSILGSKGSGRRLLPPNLPPQHLADGRSIQPKPLGDLPLRQGSLQIANLLDLLRIKLRRRSPAVLDGRRGLQVVRVEAGPVVADVVDLQIAFRQLAMVQ